MRLIDFAGAVALTLALAVPASAQYSQRDDQAANRQSVTATDIQRLQDQVYDASNELGRLRSRDQAEADRLQTRLDDARDDVIYLRVKLRREGSVSRGEYMDVRREVEAIRSETRADARPGNSTWPNGSDAGAPGDSRSGSGTWPAPTAGQRARRGEIPAGTELDVRLERELSSATTRVEDRFTATTLADLYQDNEVLIPAGSTLRGIVSSVTPATRTERKGSLTVSFDQIRINGRTYPINATVSQALESEGIRGEAGKIGAGAGVGAIIGGILGGAKGALLGILIGGGGTIAATEGTDVDLPAGTVLRVRMEQPLQIR